MAERFVDQGISRTSWLGALVILALAGCAASVSGGGDSGTNVRVDGGACVLSNGALCPLNSVCTAPDGCNTCFCSSSGLSCTLQSCLDAGPLFDSAPSPACASSRDCEAGTTCVFEQGCNARGRCLAIACTDDIASYCGCDGQTFTSSSTCPERGFVSRGPCPGPVDAGRDSGGVCRPAPPMQIRAARVMRVGQSSPVMAIAPGAGCGCAPTISLTEPNRYSANVCGCCDACACVDPPYAMGVLHTPVHEMAFPVIENMVTTTQIMLPNQACAMGSVSIQNVTGTTNEFYQTTGPLKPAYWIRVQGVISRCAESDIVEVTASYDLAARVIRLTPADCTLVDCAGPRVPRTWEGWYYLSQATPGAWRILDRSNRLLTSVTLP